MVLIPVRAILIGQPYRDYPSVAAAPYLQSMNFHDFEGSPQSTLAWEELLADNPLTSMTSVLDTQGKTSPDGDGITSHRIDTATIHRSMSNHVPVGSYGSQHMQQAAQSNMLLMLYPQYPLQPYPFDQSCGPRGRIQTANSYVSHNQPQLQT